MLLQIPPEITITLARGKLLCVATTELSGTALLWRNFSIDPAQFPRYQVRPGSQCGLGLTDNLCCDSDWWRRTDSDSDLRPCPLSASDTAHRDLSCRDQHIGHGDGINFTI